MTSLDSFIFKDECLEMAGVCLIETDPSGRVAHINRCALENILSSEININESIFTVFQYEGRSLSVEEAIKLPPGDHEVSLKTTSDKVRNYSLHLSQLRSGNYLLTLKDLSSLREVDHEIRELQNQLVESAYRDGVAENAVSVLHNIGNILTTIILTMDNDSEVVDLSLLSNVLGKLSSTLSNVNTPEEFAELIIKDPKAKAIPKLIKELAKTATGTESAIKETFEFVKGKCGHIAEVIAAQQAYANFKDKTRSKVSARKIVSDCLVMHRERMTNRGINVVIEEFPVVNLWMEKIGFAQTLSNAIMNAIEAIDERFSKDPTYTDKEIRVSANGNEHYLLIKIQDNGIGIPEDVLAKLFKFGFSTKNRSSGFGLHNCSNFMISNKGKMELQSDGLMKGATTLLFCPIYKEGDKNE